MKLRTINDAVSDERRRIIKELNKLAKDAELAASEELHTLLKDPVGMVRHTLAGIKADFSLLEDETWWHQMFEYWDHLEPEFLMSAYEEIYTDVMERIKKAVEAGVMVESKLGGFLGIIAKIGLLFLMLAFGPSLMGLGKDKHGRDHRNRRGGGRREPNIRHPSRDDLPPTPATLAAGENTFEIRRLNPYIVYKFVEACVNETKKRIAGGELESFEDPAAPGDLGAEREIPDAEDSTKAPYNSGEEVTYPEPDEELPF